jgi:uncharacterized membrane protein (Fun14 family)
LDTGFDKDTSASWLQAASPATMAITGSYLGGFFIGWGARRTIKITSIVAGILLAVVSFHYYHTLARQVLMAFLVLEENS